VKPVVEIATRRDVIVTLRALGYDANQISEAVIQALEPPHD
jgi:Holliday junction resolvasome RuvABC DNA-binding subunit